MGGKNHSKRGITRILKFHKKWPFNIFQSVWVKDLFIHFLNRCNHLKKKKSTDLTVIFRDSLRSDISISYNHAPSEHSKINEYKSLKHSTWNC